MAKWMNELHSKKKLCKSISLLKSIKPYFRNVEIYRNSLGLKTQEEVSLLFNQAKEFCTKNDNIFIKRNKSSLLHGDLSLGNIIYHNKKVRLLDWEFSNYNFPEWDLIYFISELGLTKSQEELFLKSYGYPLSKRSNLSIFLLLKFCGDIGYSTWRLGLISQGKLDKKLKSETTKRLNQDIKELKKIIRKLKK